MMPSSRVTSSKFILFILPTGIARFASYESDMDHFLNNQIYYFEYLHKSILLYGELGLL